MSKNKKLSKKIESLEQEYSKIIDGFNGIFTTNQPPVTLPSDMFVKFSLYTQSPVTTTSTNTSK